MLNATELVKRKKGGMVEVRREVLTAQRFYEGSRLATG